MLEGLEDGKGVGPSTEQALLTPSGSRWAKLALEEQLHQMWGERLVGWGPVWRPLCGLRRAVGRCAVEPGLGNADPGLKRGWAGVSDPSRGVPVRGRRWAWDRIGPDHGAGELN